MPDFHGKVVEFENARCLHATGKALRVELEDCETPKWVPQSQIDDESEVWQDGDEGTLIVSEWFATENGWV